MTTATDRFVRWTLDFDGDLYGDDERERPRWYEGIAVAAQAQWTAVPWTAAALVRTLGRSSVLPLTVLLAAVLIPMAFCPSMRAAAGSPPHRGPGAPSGCF